MYKRIMLIIFAMVVILNLSAWLLPGLSDWYTLYVTPLWVGSIGRLFGIFPFSVGELLLVLALLLLTAALVIGIVFVFCKRRERYRRFAVTYYKALLCILLIVCLIITLNCSMLYHCSPLDPNPDAEYRRYSVEELELLRNYIVEECNFYADRVSRDEDGYLLYDGDMQQQAKEALRGLSDRYPKLSGYYPNVKTLFFSDLMSQAYMAGYYFPFSMEANCNGNMYISNYPEVYCHELSHLHGYIYEDEANFLSFLACKESGDEFFIYCGYLSVLNYVDNAYFESIDGDVARYMAQPAISQRVRDDNVFLLPETWERVEETAVFSTDAVDGASDTFTEISLQLNGVKEGMASYDAVVDLLLQYYDGKLY